MELMGKENPYKSPFKGPVVQNTSFEADISMGIQEAKEESKEEPKEESKDDSLRRSLSGIKTFLQFKLNNGVTLNTSVNLETTTVLNLKERIFKADIDNGKVVRMIFMGKMMKDENLLCQYKLKNMSFISVIISNALVRPEGAQPADGEIETIDGKTGFDRFIKMQNQLYTDMQVHQMRLVFHSLMMRSGAERTDETADGLLEKEEEWLTGTLVSDQTIDDLIDCKTVLSCRNDIVLPTYKRMNEPVVYNENTK